jgi:hypothetical protein
MDSTLGHAGNLRCFEVLQRLLARLHAQRAHPNRELHYDQVITWLVLAFFNPTLRSLRALQHASGDSAFQERSGLQRFSLGSFSEATHVFDPQPLRDIFQELSAKTRARNAPARPSSLPGHLDVLAVDGSLWKALPRMARAFYREPLTRCRKGGLKGHFLFDVLRSVPAGCQVTEGSTDERHVLSGQLQAHVFYVLDRGYLSGALFQQISAAGGSFLSRLKEDSAWDVLQKHPVSAPAAAAGVQSDQRVRWLNRELRLVVVERALPAPTNLHPRKKNGKHRAAPRADGTQRWLLITDRFDLAAEDLVLLYAYRWHIEIFFRWLKSSLRCRHLFAESENGFALQLYAALIATLLVMLYTGCKPTLRLFEALSLYIQGWASEEHIWRTAAKAQLRK